MPTYNDYSGSVAYKPTYTGDSSYLNKDTDATNDKLLAKDADQLTSKTNVSKSKGLANDLPAATVTKLTTYSNVLKSSTASPDEKTYARAQLKNLIPASINQIASGIGQKDCGAGKKDLTAKGVSFNSSAFNVCLTPAGLTSGQIAVPDAPTLTQAHLDPQALMAEYKTKYAGKLAPPNGTPDSNAFDAQVAKAESDYQTQTGAGGNADLATLAAQRLNNLLAQAPAMAAHTDFSTAKTPTEIKAAAKELQNVTGGDLTKLPTDLQGLVKNDLSVFNKDYANLAANMDNSHQISGADSSGMWGIAEDLLKKSGNKNPTDAQVTAYWKSLVNANTNGNGAKLDDPNVVHVGDKLVVPDPPAAPGAPKAPGAQKYTPPPPAGYDRLPSGKLIRAD